MNSTTFFFFCLCPTNHKAAPYTKNEFKNDRLKCLVYLLSLLYIYIHFPYSNPIVYVSFLFE
ncbi:hypothetical protein BCR42DRAFT_406077 [Absidia repens]|uniref:Uncharacterized protein n=1 Tax=Absidia repens TaxID=90262 RepID=A0A1X2IUC5_9FUNG|nr:hypothetical protein BCR42DRAFT_406077 [Absidia repens]